MGPHQIRKNNKPGARDSPSESPPKLRCILSIIWFLTIGDYC